MSTRFYVGTRKGLFTFEKIDGTWKQTAENFLGIEVPMFLPDSRNGNLLVAVDHGHFGTKLHRTQNGGETWDELDPPKYPEKPEDAPVIKDFFRQVEVPWSLQKIWAMEEGGDDLPGLIWCGTIPGGLFRSDDNGTSWEFVWTLWDLPERAKWAGGGYDFPGIHSICVHPEDSRKVALGISCGGVWHTENSGETWEQGAHGMKYDFMPEDQGGADPDGQDPHRMVQCANDPDHFWVQHHSSIYRSTSGGRQWEEVENVKPSGFGFAVAVHPDDAKTAWFVPARKDEYRYPVDGKFVVTRTRDGGETIDVLSDGLPEAPAYDLVYRHAFEVADDGKTLAMGSTTGGLWVSDDQGDSWQLVTAHLPPVYCVRFG